MILGLERNTLETARLRLRQSVEIAQPGIGHRPVGIDEPIQGQVLCEHLAEKLHRLGLYAGFQPRLVAGIELFVRREHAHAVQLQPLPRKVIDEAIGFAVREHPVHFTLQYDGHLVRRVFRQIGSRILRRAGSPSYIFLEAALGRGNECIVRHRTPEEIREPRGEFRVGQMLASHRFALDEVDEVPGRQHALQCDPIGIGHLLARLALGAVGSQIPL